MKKYYRSSNVNEVKMVQVIEVKSIVGKGTPDDQVRQIIEYFDLDGHLLARYNNQEELETVLVEERDE